MRKIVLVTAIAVSALTHSAQAFWGWMPANNVYVGNAPWDMGPWGDATHSGYGQPYSYGPFNAGGSPYGFGPMVFAPAPRKPLQGPNAYNPRKTGNQK